MRNGLTIALTVAVGLFVVVGPVAASTGSVGYYSLKHPGATVKYVYTSDTYESYWKIRRLVVRPPNMMAVPGKSQQSVGWRFKVQRIACFEPPCTDWETTYTSPIYAAVTSDKAFAPFVKQSVGVRCCPANPGLF